MKYNSDDLIKVLIQHEGLRLSVYKDTLGYDTIGIGRNLHDRGISDVELRHMDIPSMDTIYEHGITEADAMYLAKNDVQIVEEELMRAHPCVDKLDAVRQLVLVDMGYNLGIPRLKLFTRMWNFITLATETDSAAQKRVYFNLARVEMMSSKWADQVGKRANRLAAAMNFGEMEYLYEKT